MAHPTITPGLLYHNAPAMIEWLCASFGFEKKLVVPGEHNRIIHAHLILGNGGIMISSAESNTTPAIWQSPRLIEGRATSVINVYIKGVDTHYKKVTESGADILIALEDKPYGGRGYTCKDPEGYIWNFSSYNPWDEHE